MPAFAFWNTYRLGGGSGEAKRIIIEGVLAQIFDSHQAEFAILCEVTGDVQLGDAPVSRQLYTASRRHGQLAYSAFDDDLSAHDLERADINDFIDVFGQAPHKKGGGKFSRQSKRPVAYAGQAGGTNVFVYHANASAKSSFLVAWVAESLNQDYQGNFIIAGDLNCSPLQFATSIDLCTSTPNYHAHFSAPNGGHTHNAKSGLVSTYDWAIVGAKWPKGGQCCCYRLHRHHQANGFHRKPALRSPADRCFMVKAEVASLATRLDAPSKFVSTYEKFRFARA